MARSGAEWVTKRCWNRRTRPVSKRCAARSPTHWEVHTLLREALVLGNEHAYLGWSEPDARVHARDRTARAVTADVAWRDCQVWRARTLSQSGRRERRDRFGDVPMTRGGEFRVAEQRRCGGQPSPLCLGARTAL
jgi:hypothetical protein